MRLVIDGAPVREINVTGTLFVSSVIVEPLLVCIRLSSNVAGPGTSVPVPAPLVAPAVKLTVHVPGGNTPVPEPHDTLRPPAGCLVDPCTMYPWSRTFWRLFAGFCNVAVQLARSPPIAIVVGVMLSEVMPGVATRLTLMLLFPSSVWPFTVVSSTRITSTAAPGTSVPLPSVPFDATIGMLMSHPPAGRKPGASPGLHYVGPFAAWRVLLPCTMSAR